MAQSLTYSGDQPPERFNLARHCLSGKPVGKTALIVAGEKTEAFTYGELEERVLEIGRAHV